MTDTIETPDVDDPVEVADKPREPTPYERKLRTEAANARVARKVAEDAATAAKSHADTEIARITTETRTAADQRIIRAELKAAALQAGMVDFDGLKIIDTSAIALSETGDIVIPDGFFAAAKLAKPYLFGQPSTSNPTPPPPSTPPVAKLASAMTHDEWRAAEAALIKAR